MTTAVTNLDIHDIARAAKTFGVRGYYIVTPIAQQRSLVRRIVAHWLEGEGRVFNPIRSESFDIVSVTDSLEATVEAIEAEVGHPILTMATGATLDDTDTTWQQAAKRVREQSETALVIFGTGWGLTEEVTNFCDVRLPAIRAERSEYNHLSVRSAVSIVLDRLLGAR